MVRKPVVASVDPEIAAMSTLRSALEPLDAETRERVINWACQRYSIATVQQRIVSHAVSGVSPLSSHPRDRGQDRKNPSVGDDAVQRQTLGEFFASCGPPAATADQALVVASYLQGSEFPDGFPARRVQAELKHIGRQTANITNTLSALMRRRPQHVVQIKKSGSAQQAHKLYKVTLEGMTAVQKMQTAHDNRESP